MRGLTLRYRLLLLTLLPSTLISVVLVAFFTASGIRSLENELRAKALSTVRYLAPISEYGIIAGHIDSLHSLAHATLQEPGVKAAVIVNQKGRAIAVSGRVSLTSDLLRSPVPTPGLVAENEGWVAYGAPVKRSASESDVLFEFSPPGQENASAEVIGHVFVEFDKRELSGKRRELLEQATLIMSIGLIPLGLLAIFVADGMSAPVRRLAEAVRKMSAAHFNTRVPESTSGEIGILERGFNEMAEHIEEVHHSMQLRIEEATAQLAYQARHDALTGLINRREFEARLEKALRSVQAGGTEFCVLFIDLDRFKPVNDACGHLAGDELLRQIAQLFQTRLRGEDTLGRLGGDEFGIILHDCKLPNAMQIANDICMLAGDYRFIWQDKVFAVGASIGATAVDRHVRRIKDILAAGDQACYQAKEAGRNRVCAHQPENDHNQRLHDEHWAIRIPEALAEQRLQIDALPLRALQTGLPARHVVEIGARMHEPGRPPILLPALIDAAERYELSEAVDHYLLTATAQALAHARDHGRNLFCLVPLSASAIDRPGTLKYIAGLLNQHRLDGGSLCLLFPEELSTHHASQLTSFAREANKLGCTIGLQEFGGGLSSFGHLRTLAPAFIKISPSLTLQAGSNKTSTALLRAIKEIAADLGIHSVATEISDVDSLGALKSLGLDYGQGYAVAPCEPLEVWLEGAVIRNG
ncbi:diguanylate cyclase [Dechloromonas sp. ZY10]|uniref:diguanylate cyclase n=1 Tax=Dechloromonas aquae TaxID=2664436 RepID=UPI003528557B